MKRSLTLCFVFVILFFNASCTNKAFKIVLLPDTQTYSESFPEIYYAQTKWIAENSDSIAFVLHQGDITNHNTPEEWEVAARAMNMLDGKVPYVLCTGNHDYGTRGTNDIRDSKNFNTWFPYEKHSKTIGFGGAYEEGKMNNVWYVFEAGGIDWLILSLEFGPRNKIIEWAAGVVEKHPSHKVILNTHVYMYSDDTRMSAEREHRWHPTLAIMNKGATGEEAVNDGEQIWEKLAGQYPNILFVISGHVLNDGTGTLVSEGKHGNKVYQMLANYQKYVDGSVNGGNGFLRILTINPGKGKISVKTYSPYLDEYKTDPSQQFEFEGVKF